ncbi:MAG: PAS domain-containing protein [Verrucomicrobia bacterium]|nr:PAS domain-containing protein [Verrucomicrobiota bacterium]
MDTPTDASAGAVALRMVNHVPAMLAYWDAAERCVFANAAYHDWFGRDPEQMRGIALEELLGALYAKNLPYIRGALAGRRQVFERSIPLPTGEIRDTVATYTPDVVGGVVRGFSVHVADVTMVRRREMALREAINEAIPVLANTKRSFQSKEIGLLRERLLQLTMLLERAEPDARSATKAENPPISLNPPGTVPK